MKIETFFGEEMCINLDERAEQIFRLAKEHNLVQEETRAW